MKRYLLLGLVILILIPIQSFSFSDFKTPPSYEYLKKWYTHILEWTFNFEISIQEQINWIDYMESVYHVNPHDLLNITREYDEKRPSNKEYHETGSLFDVTTKICHTDNNNILTVSVDITNNDRISHVVYLMITGTRINVSENGFIPEIGSITVNSGQTVTFDKIIDNYYDVGICKVSISRTD